MDTKVYRPEIDGLRALAVISVIINHFSHDILPSGHLGVDIFFVISGYVITASLYNKPTTSLSSLLLAFYARRMKRLLPALLVCVLLSTILICLFDSNPGTSIKTGFFSLFGLSNLYLAWISTDYFGGLAQLNPFTHTWSLGVEEQFYFLFPLLVWLSGFGRLRSGSRSLAWAISVLSVISFVAFCILEPHISFFLMPTRLWELGAGALLFVALCANRRAALPIPPGLPMLLLITALFFPSDFSILGTAAVVLATLLLLASVRPATLCFQILSHPVATYFGRISYSLYLWHWVVLTLSRWTIGIHPWSVPLQIGIMVLLADTSYRYIENPLRRAEWAPHHWKAICRGAAALSIAGGLLLGTIVSPLASLLYTGTPPQMAAIGVESLINIYSPAGLPFSWNGEECVLSDNSDVGKIFSIEECTLGDHENAERRVLVLGNSFSAAFVQAFDDLVKTDNYAVTITSSWGASPYPEMQINGHWDKANNYYWEDVVPSLIKHLRPGDVVFLINDLAEFSAIQETAASRRRLIQFKKGLGNLAEELSDQGIGLAVLHGNPLVRDASCEPAAALPQWFMPFGSPCRFYSREETLLRRAALDDSLSSLQTQGKIAVVDLMDVFCPGDTCTYEASNGHILYRDSSSHPSVEAARLSAPIIRAQLKSIHDPSPIRIVTSPPSPNLSKSGEPSPR